MFRSFTTRCASIQAYLSLADGNGRVRDLERPGPATNVPVVGLEGDQGDRSEEREPGGEGDAETEEGTGLASPPTREVLLLSMAPDRETSLIKRTEGLLRVVFRTRRLVVRVVASTYDAYFGYILIHRRTKN